MLETEGRLFECDICGAQYFIADNDLTNAFRVTEFCYEFEWKGPFVSGWGVCEDCQTKHKFVMIDDEAAKQKILSSTKQHIRDNNQTILIG